MLNKEELLAKDVAELADIANELGAEFHANDDKETIIYAILDKQAVEGSIAPKRKRTYCQEVGRPCLFRQRKGWREFR